MGRWRQVHGQITRLTDTHLNRNKQRALRKQALNSGGEVRKAFWWDERGERKSKGEQGMRGTVGISSRGRRLLKAAGERSSEDCSSIM